MESLFQRAAVSWNSLHFYLSVFYHPIDYYYENKDSEEGFDRTPGIAIIVKMARDVIYRTNFGVNNLIITIK
jgi:hypothetical protein